MYMNDACTHTKFNRTLNGIIPFAFILESAMDDFSWDSVSTTTVGEVLSLIVSSASYISIEIEKRGRVVIIYYITSHNIRMILTISIVRLNKLAVSVRFAALKDWMRTFHVGG